MRDKRLQNKIATSSFTLPVAVLVTTIVWLLKEPSNLNTWAGLVCMGAASYILIELNNTNTLLRIRSRLISTTFICLAGCATMLHSFSMSHLLVICVTMTYYLLFRSYQKSRSVGYIFHAFVFASIGSLILPQMLYIIPTYYLAMLIQLRSFSLRNFMASLIGLILPYYCYAASLIYKNKLEDILIPFREISVFVLSFPPKFEEHQKVLLIFVTILSVISIINFYRTSFNDKIRIRMFFYILIVQWLLLTALLCFQPQHFGALMPVIIMNSSPIIAHYFALTNGIFCKIIFILTLLSLIFLTIYNLWIPSFPFL